nr:MAG TPA: hypothetical protein [Microviridae sp.]
MHFSWGLSPENVQNLCRCSRKSNVVRSRPPF